MCRWASRRKRSLPARRTATLTETRDGGIDHGVHHDTKHLAADLAGRYEDVLGRNEREMRVRPDRGRAWKRGCGWDIASVDSCLARIIHTKCEECSCAAA